MPTRDDGPLDGDGPSGSAGSSRNEQRRLVRHGLGVLSLSTWVAGMFQAAAASAGIKSEAQFRTAHVGGTVHAALMFGMAGALDCLSLNEGDKSQLVSWTAVTGWFNSSGYLIGALLGARGLNVSGNKQLAGGTKNAIPFSMFVIAIYALVRMTLLTWKGTKTVK